MARQDGAVGQFQGLLGGHRGEPLPAQRLALVGRAPEDLVEFAVELENKLDGGVDLGFGEVRAQLVRRAIGARAFVVEGKGDGIEDHGLAGPGVPRDQKE